MLMLLLAASIFHYENQSVNKVKKSLKIEDLRTIIMKIDVETLGTKSIDDIDFEKVVG